MLFLSGLPNVAVSRYLTFSGPAATAWSPAQAVACLVTQADLQEVRVASKHHGVILKQVQAVSGKGLLRVDGALLR